MESERQYEHGETLDAEMSPQEARERGPHGTLLLDLSKGRKAVVERHEEVAQNVEKEVVLEGARVVQTNVEAFLEEDDISEIIAQEQEDGTFLFPTEIVIRSRGPSLEDQTWSVGKALGRGANGAVFELEPMMFEEEEQEEPTFLNPPPGHLVKFLIIESRGIPVQKKVQEMKFLRKLWNEMAANDLCGTLLSAQEIEARSISGEPMETRVFALVLEKRPGVDMRKWMASVSEKEKYSIDHTLLAAEMLEEVLIQLRFLHARGWTHRDVKPANISVYAGFPKETKLFDYGLAMIHKDLLQEQDEPMAIPGKPEGQNKIAGTPSLLFPDAYRNQDTDPRIRDYWGAILSFALDALGYLGTNPVQHVSNVSEMSVQGTYLIPFHFDPPLSLASQELYEWIMNFLQPRCTIEQRWKKWEELGLAEMSTHTFHTEKFFEDFQKIKEKLKLEGTLRQDSPSKGTEPAPQRISPQILPDVSIGSLSPVGKAVRESRQSNAKIPFKKAA